LSLCIDEEFDNESHISWFSIYPELDDCASDITFLMDGEDVKVGKKCNKSSKFSRECLNASNATGRSKAELKQESFDCHDPLLQKRIESLQSGKFFQEHEESKEKLQLD